MTNTETAPRQRKKSPDELRRENQRALALHLASNDIATFPSVDKSSVVKEWPRLDTSIRVAEINKIHGAAQAEGKRKPLHIGSTRRASVVKRLWNAWPDATPSIPCGVNGLIAIDVDIKRNKSTNEITYHGPQLFEAFCKEKGIVIGPDVPMTRSQSGEGFHLIYRNPLGLGSSAGGFAELGCDIRGGNADGTEGSGQVVSPGAWREDGKRYESAKGHVDFVTAFAEGTIPDLPEAFVKLIGTRRSGESNSVSVSEREVQALSAELQQTELPDAATLLDPVLDGLDMPKIEQRYPKLREAISKGNFSDIRFNLAGALKAERADITAAEYASILFERDDCGEFVGDAISVAKVSFNWRNVSKDFLRATPQLTEASTGEQFAEVEDEEDDGTPVPDNVKRLAENIRRKAEREAAVRAAAQVGASTDVKSTKTTSEKAPKVPTIETWYTNAAFVPVDLDIDALPPRPYIYGTYLQRGHVTLLSASGGVGKSAWSLSAGIDLACGVDHLGAGDFKRRKVLVYNAEDDTQEMLRRAGAYMRHHNFTTEMRRHVRENLTIISGVNGALQFADYRDGRVLILQNSVALFKQILREREIEVAMLDPLVGLHNIPENANSEMNGLIMEIKAITATQDIASLVSHHDKKNIGGKDVEDASQDDARGAGTITTPMRVVLSMKRLSKADVKRLNIPAEDVPRVVALSKGAKSNYSPRDTGSRLFYMNSVQAKNGSDEFKADNTVALSVYKLKAGPQMTDDQRDEILAEIAKGEFRSDAQANLPVVQFITDVVGMDSDADGKRYVTALLSEWLKLGWIVKEKAKVTGHKREVPVYKRGPDRPPAAKAGFSAVDDEDE